MKSISEQLDLKLPIIQAPLECYSEQTILVAKTSECGCLGTYSANHQTLEEITTAIDDITAYTQRAFAVMLSVAEIKNGETSDLADMSIIKNQLENVYANLDVTDNTILPTSTDVIDLLLTKAPPAIIFQNGLPSDENIKKFKHAGTFTFAIASNTLEAIACATSPVDAIILQGVEAAGVHSKFQNDLVTEAYPINTLLHHALACIDKPVVVWGDYQESPNIVSALVNGANAVMIDTPFWTTHESPVPNGYLNALAHSNEMLTTISSLWTGYPARVIANELTHKFTHSAHTLLPIKQQQELMLPIIKAAIIKNDINYMPMWAGLCTVNSNCQIDELIEKYSQELSQIIETE